jgi:hypothetical protein
MNTIKDCQFVGCLFGDGVTDDTRTLQELIDTSGKLDLPPGVYLVSRPLVLKKKKK